MKEPAVLLIASLLALLCAALVPSAVNAQPAPPQSVDSQWQPPDDGTTIDPPVTVEIYNYSVQGSQLVAPPLPVEPGINSSITNAYLVNSYGHLLNTLYQGEKCYLILSVNGPGNLYIWEYYPSGPPYGHWLCYRWYRPGVGVWKIGPFTAAAGDPEGKYTWKLWYLSGPYWSTRILSFDYTRRYSPYVIQSPLPVTVQTPVLVQQPVYQPAAVNSFAASQSTIEAGQNVTLSWSTTNANGVSISPGVGTVGTSGSTMVAPVTSTTYTLTAGGRTGNPATSSVTVIVNPRVAPNISINRDSLPKGESAILTWSAPGAASVSISGLGSQGQSGSIDVWPEETKVYTLTASYYDGSSQRASATVNVEETPVLLYGLLALLTIAAAAIVFLLIRKSIQKPPSATPLTRPTTEAIASTAPAVTAPADTSVIIAPAARLTLPDGDEIMLAGSNRSFGRRDFEKFLPQDKLTYFSRQHFTISYDEGHYCIEDHASTNGTLVNGQEIRGSGKRVLEDKDVIDIATKLKATFNINSSKEDNNET